MKHLRDENYTLNKVIKIFAESLCNIANIKNTHLQQKDFVWISESFNDIPLPFLKKIAITNKTTQLPLSG